MKKILIFIGTRPEAVKLSPVIGVLKAKPDDFTVSVCCISQHRQMLAQTLRWLPQARPDMDMDIMRDDQTLADTAAAALVAAQQAIARTRPDIVIVQGDTTTALAAALAGFYGGVAVAHVEAGLRSGNRYSPWPEEINRTLIGKLADYHFAPTEKNAAALRADHVAGTIRTVGNTVIDALLDICRRLDTDPALSLEIKNTLAAAGYMPAAGRDIILVTGHRRESFGQGLENICRALSAIAAAHAQLDIVYAVHLNPHVRDTTQKILAECPAVKLLPPLDYGAFVYMMKQCRLILTDSGGVQEEAPSLNKPVLVMRNHTERQEVLDCGAARLTGTETAAIVAAADEVLSDKALYEQMAAAPNPYGDGTAAEQIAAILARV